MLRPSVFSASGASVKSRTSIDMDGERARRKVAECGQGSASWIGGKRLAGGHVQAEPVSLLALPLRGPLRVDPEPCHLVRLEQRPGPERAGQAVQAARQGKRVR